MAKAATDKLYVNLSASQTRKRLKGHGLGVKKVEAAGRKQAVIVHTATGAHLQQLKSLFDDVMPSASLRDLDIPVVTSAGNDLAMIAGTAYKRGKDKPHEFRPTTN